jgi:hypothetical protein
MISPRRPAMWRRSDGVRDELAPEGWRLALTHATMHGYRRRRDVSRTRCAGRARTGALLHGRQVAPSKRALLLLG